MNAFLLKRPVDWSLLTDGFHIPTEFHELVYAMLGTPMKHGDKRDINIIIDGETFHARLNNIGFDQNRYPGHPDLLQVRYYSSSPIAQKLQSIFSEEYRYLQIARMNAAPRTRVQLPDTSNSGIIVYTTQLDGTIMIECTNDYTNVDLLPEFLKMSEFEFEIFTPRQDENATIKDVARIQHVRQLDRSIGDSLKQLYSFRCQMTGEMVGEPYGVNCVEAHHIIPFTESMNNDTSNIIILSPSYHRIVHKAKPKFNHESLAFEFPNGLVEKVKIDKHLKINQ